MIISGPAYLRVAIALSLWATALAGSARAADPAQPRLHTLARRYAEGPGPRQIVPLLDALADLAGLDEGSFDGGAALLDWVRHVAGTAEDPLVQARARFELARLLDRRAPGGISDEAARLRAGLGLVGELGLVAGPFANDAGASLAIDSVLAPEPGILSGALSLDSTWPSGNGPDARPGEASGAIARLRPLPSVDRAGLVHGSAAPTLLAGGVIPLGALVRPETHVAVYLIFGVRVPAARIAALRLSATGGVSVWLNGRRIGARTGDRRLAFDVDAWAAPLLAGDNRFVVRVAVGDRQPELILRLTDLEGRALSDLTPIEPTGPDGATLRAARPVAPAGKRVVVRSLRTAFDAIAAPSLAEQLDRDEYLLRDEIEGAAPEKVCRAWDRGRVARSPHELELILLCAAEGDARRQALEARLPRSEDAAERIDLLTRLGEQALRGRTTQHGEELLREAVALGDPAATWRARLRLAELDADRGLTTLADQGLRALEREAPTRRVREALAQLAVRAGRRDEAERRYGALLSELPGDLSLLRQLAALERARGTPVAMRRALDRLQPSTDLRDLESIVLERVDLEAGLGESERATADLRALLALVPDDARLEERLGRHLLLIGAQDHSEALSHLEASLRLRPQNPELRSLLAEIDPARSGGADLWRRWRADPLALRARAATEALGRGDPARVLYDGATIHVHDNGLEETLVERVIEILDQRGAERQREVDVRYAPDSQTVEVRVARVYKANGEVVDAASIDERDLSEPWSGLFYDVRAQVIGLPGLEPGDVIHVAYTVSDHGRRNELGDSFGDLHLLQEELVRLESAYRLIAPRRRPIHFNAPRLSGAASALPIVTTDEGAERRYEIVARGVGKIQAEAQMPGATELGGYVHASTFADWAEVARFYRTLVAPQLVPDAEIRRAAQEAVRGKKTTEDKVAAIYDLVLRSTRYVGLEFGVHGYQPYRVSQIFSRRFGDCKDKASLLVVMLREVGVEATIILLRTRREGAVADMPASLAPFDHAIAYVPSLRRYLDGTAEFFGARELPADDQGVAVLHVDEGLLRRTPVDGAASATIDGELVLRLDADGSAEAEERLSVQGQHAAAWRQHYQAPGERKQRFEEAWGQRSPGAEVLSIELPHLEDRERPVAVRARLRLPRAARAEDGVLSIPILVREPRLLSTFGRLSTRSHPLELPEAYTEVERVHLRLPAGLRARPAPGAGLHSAFGDFSLSIDLSPRGDEVRIAARTVLSVREVSAKDYPTFRAFLAEIDRAVSGALRIEAVR